MLFHNVTVYGGGLIGSGWAACFLKSGATVTVYDLDEEKLSEAKASIKAMLHFFTEPDIEVLTPEQKEECLGRVSYTCDVRAAVEHAEFIQENGPERLEIKQSMVEAIEEFNATAILASSTSALLITDIAAKAKFPQRIIAGHPFHPVHIVPLVELSGGEHTSQEALDQAYGFYKQIGKEPVVLQKECRGFIANSIQNVVYNEALDLVSRGVCTVEDLDKAMTFGPGLRWGLMGPYLVLELAGGKGGIWARMMKFPNPDNIDIEMICGGVGAEISRRSPGHGNDQEGLARFRDRGLVEILKYHGKL